MKKLIAIAALFILLPFYAQNRVSKNSITGNGTMQTITRTTKSYNSISVGGSFNVILTNGKEGNISITGEENLLEYVVTEVDGDNLKIHFEKDFKNYKLNNKIEIRVPIEKIEALALSGSGNITTETEIRADKFSTAQSGSGKMNLQITTQNMESALSGSGHLHLSGSTKNFEIAVSGSGKIDSQKLDSEAVTAAVSGSGTITVSTKEAIKAVVSGSGQIRYYGNPRKIEQKVSGSGGIYKA